MRPPAVRSTVARSAAVALLLGGLAACGLDDREQDAAHALADALAEGAPKSAQESAACVAEAWVGETGTGPLVADGLLTKALDARPRVLSRVQAGRRTVSAETAEGYAAAWVSCADYDVIALDHQDSGASDEELDEYADCLKEVDDDQLAQAIADTWGGNRSSAAARSVAAQHADCDAELGR